MSHGRYGLAENLKTLSLCSLFFQMTRVLLQVDATVGASFECALRHVLVEDIQAYVNGEMKNDSAHRQSLEPD